MSSFTLRTTRFAEHEIDKSLSKKKQAFQREKLKCVTQIAREITEHTSKGISVRCPQLTKTLRYKLRQILAPCWKENGYFVESRGKSHDRCMYVWRNKDMRSVLVRVIPHHIVDNVILPIVHADVRAKSDDIQAEKTRQIQKNTRLYFCDGCGYEGTAGDILVSVYHSGKFCESCIEEDDDMRGSKWEDALP